MAGSKFERGGWLQVYELPERAGAGSCTLAVSDIEKVIAHLQELEIDTSEQASGAKVGQGLTPSVPASVAAMRSSRVAIPTRRLPAARG